MASRRRREFAVATGLPRYARNDGERSKVSEAYALAFCSTGCASP